MNLILIVVGFVGVIMMSKNFLHLKFGRISEIELLEFVFEKFVIGVLLATSPLFLRAIGEVFLKKKMPPTMFNIFFLIILVVFCFIGWVMAFVDYRKAQKVKKYIKENINIGEISEKKIVSENNTTQYIMYIKAEYPYEDDPEIYVWLKYFIVDEQTYDRYKIGERFNGTGLQGEVILCKVSSDETD